jgi:hypothetical protein
MTAILREEPPELAETGWQGPLGLQRILSRCLEKSVERRFQSASDLAFAIESLSGTSPATSGPQPGLKLEPAQPSAKRSLIPWAVALGGAVLLTAAWFVWHSAFARPLLKYTRLDLSAGLCFECSFCPGWANHRLQRAVEQRSAAGLHGAGRVSAIDEGGLAERHVTRTLRKWRYRDLRRSGLQLVVHDWNHGRGADGGRHPSPSGEKCAVGGLRAGWKDLGGSARDRP